ncbi:MAG: aldehyde dehydrogenase family protein [Sporocytophaga sp.]|uniref:L-piperidine-6-carboxylate dehydrogenase n=1 Tax=Sporocytophaga sp. TaxID=2231183 RepID=UPI001B257874|nr:aldehyde dehydrogenase family protein [Sporocytophaga sp.]MBO9701626.1 aldehyde dehydrogenase family protein [Sporocytophaga sp.]
MKLNLKGAEKIDFAGILTELGLKNINPAFSTGKLDAGKGKRNIKEIFSPVDGGAISKVYFANDEDYDHVIVTAQKAFEEWRQWPAPKRGEIVRQIGNRLREHKDALGKLVTWETGKIMQEGWGEVQEMIDICDLAVGLSRQLQGFTMHSERPEHRMYDQYHPLGLVGIISAFNFPVAVWSWNAMLAAVCGDVCIWKPSEKTPLTAVACQNIIKQVLKENQVPEGVFSYIIGGAEIGVKLSEDTRIPLISATGSTRMGKKVGEKVGARLGKSLLELGGNNAIIVTEKADLDLAIRAIVFGAVGTCGQRCTTTRRIIVHENVYDVVKKRLKKIYNDLPIGNPFKQGILVGPLIDKAATENYLAALKRAVKEGGKLVTGGTVIESKEFHTGTYVNPALVEAKNEFSTVQEETFAPILYMIKYSGPVTEAIRIQNDVKQGLSSSIFSNDIRETETFLSHFGSDCGIANVNIGTSGAEIGGAFGGEKETGGGRESGSDAWKVYMRRQTNTINFSSKLPLAQGIKFDL